MKRLTRRADAGRRAGRLPGRRAPRTGRCASCVGYPAGRRAATPSRRLVADKMRASLGRSVIVENKPGAAA